MDLGKRYEIQKIVIIPAKSNKLCAVCLLRNAWALGVLVFTSTLFTHWVKYCVYIFFLTWMLTSSLLIMPWLFKTHITSLSYYFKLTISEQLALHMLWGKSITTSMLFCVLFFNLLLLQLVYKGDLCISNCRPNYVCWNWKDEARSSPVYRGRL